MRPCAGQPGDGGTAALSFACDVQALNYSVSYGYTSAGVTYTSAAALVRCTSGPAD